MQRKRTARTVKAGHCSRSGKREYGSRGGNSTAGISPFRSIRRRFYGWRHGWVAASLLPPLVCRFSTHPLPC